VRNKQLLTNKSFAQCQVYIRRTNIRNDHQYYLIVIYRLLHQFIGNSILNKFHFKNLIWVTAGDMTGKGKYQLSKSIIFADVEQFQLLYHHFKDNLIHFKTIC
jgi:uncharacterized protein YaaW (UPF0174 family)